MHGFEAFDLMLWLVPIGDLAIVAMLVALALRWVTRRRGATSWIPVFLPILVCLLTAAIFVPFCGTVAWRIDRVLGRVDEPVFEMRSLATSVAVTLTLAATFIAVTRQRRTPSIAKQAALVTAAILCGVFLSLYWLFLVVPPMSDWMPNDWDRPNLITPFRPCRGALLWITSNGSTRPFGRIDDVWLRFADPRVPGELVYAISVRGEWRDDYIWLNRSEAEQLYLRRDDPLVAQCEWRARARTVAPAQWHTIGLE